MIIQVTVIVVVTAFIECILIDVFVLVFIIRMRERVIKHDGVPVASDPRFLNQGAWWYGVTQHSDTRSGAVTERSAMILHSTMVKLLREADDISRPFR